MEEDPGPSGGGSGAGDLVSGSGSASRQARRRPLSTTQLSRKRQLDRAKKRVNRAEQKNRLESIERDVSLMRESIAELVKHLRKGKALSNPGNLPQAVDGPSMESVDGQLPTIQGSPASSTDLSDSEEELPAHGDALDGMDQWQQTHRIQPAASHTLQHHEQHSQAGFPFRYGTQQSTASSGTAMPRGGTDILPYNSDYLPTSATNAAIRDASWWHSGDVERQNEIPSNLYAFMESSLSNNIHIQPYTGYAHTFLPGAAGGLWMKPQFLECRCGLVHESSEQCTDQIFFQLVFQSGAPAVLPKNPSIRRILRKDAHNDKQAAFPILNELANGLEKVLLQYQFCDLATMLGIFFLAYRFGRWHMHPTADVYADIPGSMRPTNSQKLYPHPFFFNSIPWPGLREALCSQVGQDRRHTLSTYIPSFRFKWPKDKELIMRDFEGGPALHPEFESYVCDIRYWSMGSPWTDQFPDLLHCLNYNWQQ